MIMLLQPKKFKYRRQFVGVDRGRAHRGNALVFGEYGLKAVTGARISARQIEAARKAIVHYTKREGKIWIRVFPDKPMTKKPKETRMGSGKSAVDHYAAIVKPGRIIFEVAGLPEAKAKRALRLAGDKLSVRTVMIQ